MSQTPKNAEKVALTQERVERLECKVDCLDQKMEKVMTNHLPHIDAKLDTVVESVDWLKYIVRTVLIGILVSLASGVILFAFYHFAQSK
jgi:archaellum component FlaC